MGECTCHSCAPCGYCVEGTAEFQATLVLAEGLDDRELDRLAEAISDLQAEREQKRVSSAAVKAVLLRTTEIAAPTAPSPTPAFSPGPVPAPTKAEWVGRLKANASFAAELVKVGTAYARAARLPINRGLWDSLDKADSGCWRNSKFSSLTGDGAKHDNRRASVRRA